MKQCEPLKEPLNAPKECAPCPAGLRNRRRMPMVHIGIVASEPVAGASDLVAVIREKQQEAHCILVPVERDEIDRIRQEAVQRYKERYPNRK